MIPRHEWLGRIVLTIGLITSSMCVLALTILWLGQRSRTHVRSVIAP